MSPALLAALVSATPALALSPEAARPGDVVRLELHGASSATAAEARLLGHRFVLGRLGEAWVGHLALPIEASPGRHPLRVRSGTVGATLELEVLERSFRSSRLRVAKKFSKKKRPLALERRLERERAAMRAVWAAPPSPPRPAVRPAAPVRRPRPTAVYGTRRVFNGELQSRHYGLDLRGGVGTPVRALLDGTVVLAADRYFSGGTVVLDHGGGLYSLYFHLSRRRVEVGERVTRGARIGAVGRSGRVTGPHLHLSVAVRAEPLAGGDARGLYVDPEPLLEGALVGQPASPRPERRSLSR